MMKEPNRWTAPQVVLPMGKETRAKLAQFYCVNILGWEIVIPAGFEADGATIPRWLWPICGHPLEVPRVYAAIVHDYLYECGEDQYNMTRKDADAVYYALLRAYGVAWWRAAIEWAAIRIFGASHWRGAASETTKERNGQ